MYSKGDVVIYCDNIRWISPAGARSLTHRAARGVGGTRMQWKGVPVSSEVLDTLWIQGTGANWPWRRTTPSE